MAASFALSLLLTLLSLSRVLAAPTAEVLHSKNANTNITKLWGPYSPYFTPSSAVPDQVPAQCEITFVNVLSRHGSREPTAKKSKKYDKGLKTIKKDVNTITGKYAFLKSFQYREGKGELTDFGRQEMRVSGREASERYKSLAKKSPPFLRAAGGKRVVESAKLWMESFHSTLLREQGAINAKNYPYPLVILEEKKGLNNTLSHGLCVAFEQSLKSKTTGGKTAQKIWADKFTAPIQERLNVDLAGMEFTSSDVIRLMDLCPFDTAASPPGIMSPFCNLFTAEEWEQYDYHGSLGKYYGYGNGNPLGPTQGVGFTNELIARMTTTQVQDSTSTNRTLNANPATFPIGQDHAIFADFSHDNTITSIFAALGLYTTSVKPLPQTLAQTAEQNGGFSASWTVPFAARAYFEKLKCTGETEEFVRVVVNGRVVLLPGCGSDDRGLCKLSAFVQSLAFAKGGGRWNECAVVKGEEDDDEEGGEDDEDD